MQQDPHRRSQAFIVLALYVLLNALSQFEWLRFAPITSRAAEEYGVDVVWIGALALCFPLLAFLLSLPMGWAIDRFGLRPSLRAAALLMAVGAEIRHLGGYPWVLAGQILFALAQPLLANSVGKLAIIWFDGPGRLRATGIATISLFGGIALAFVVVPLLPGSVAWSLTLDPGIAVPLLAMTWFLLPRDPTAVAGPAETGWVTLLRQPRFLALLAISVLGNGFFGAIFTWLEQMLRPRGFDSGTAGLAGLLLLGGGILGSAILPGFANRPGRLRPVVIGPALFALPATALLLATSDRWVLLPAAAALGSCLLSPLPVLINLVQRMGGHASAGIALSLFWLAGNAGSAGIAWLLSFPAQSGDWRLGGMFLASLLLLQGGLAFVALAPDGSAAAQEG